ncbi:hypothetical protein G6L14_02135 [Agrobacterium vitis]|uniref:hypothetical protein n=1 Tax=Agrobacterium vitis TaxID=373 RepID=UPI0015728831|nr:hypothetical protein [Agrobacterium vitis]NSY10814.1 hypothetical protein [Agrobacterium vitis]
MAEAHIGRLRRLEQCPVCQSKRLIFLNILGHYKSAYACDAIFSATVDDDKVNALKACGNATALAARLLTEECKGAAL